LLEKIIAENASRWEAEIDQIRLSGHGSVGLWFLSVIFVASFSITSNDKVPLLATIRFLNATEMEL
jgi:hypothetical protein